MNFHLLFGVLKHIFSTRASKCFPIIFLCIATQFLTACASTPAPNTPEEDLYSALFDSDYTEAHRLIAAGADINGIDSDGSSDNTILEKCIVSHCKPYSSYCPLSSIKFIVDQGADLHKLFYMGDDKGWSDENALSTAIDKKCDMDVIRYLVDEAKIPLTTEAYGLTPLHQSINKGHLNLIKYFVVEKNVPVDSKAFDDTALVYAATWGAWGTEAREAGASIFDTVSLLIELGADTSQVRYKDKKPWQEILRETVARRNEHQRELAEDEKPSQFWKNLSSVLGAMASASYDASSGAPNRSSSVSSDYNNSMRKLSTIEQNAKQKTKQEESAYATSTTPSASQETSTDNSSFNSATTPKKVTKTSVSNSDCCYDVGLSDNTYGEALDKAAAKAQKVCARKGTNLSPLHISDEKVKSSGFKFKVRLDYRCTYKSN